MCRAHQPGSKLRDRLQRLGYYWPKMIPDAIAYTKQCHAYQIYGDFIHQALGHLHRTTSSWPFEMQGMDVVGPISPPSSKRHRFILAIADYFSKWPEAIPLREIKTSDVIKFIKHHVVAALACHDRLSMIMGLSSSAKTFRDSAICSGSRVCLRRRHTTQPLMALLQLLTKPWGNFSRNSSQKASVTGMISQVNAYGLIARQ